ncbi:MAG: hypothetical protein HQL08_02195 [Nitrospirae bacterium]|nr:hypothetical protein [Nitrospirota bacterium]
MTKSRFFQLSLFFPFGVWCIYLIVSSLLNGLDISLLLSRLFDAYPIFIPYFIFAAILWKLSDKKPFIQLVILALVAPLLWGFFYAFSHAVQYYFKQKAVEPFSILAIMVFWATVAGYLIEAVPLIVLTVLRNDLKSE